jgi:hypothetical protein
MPLHRDQALAVHAALIEKVGDAVGRDAVLAHVQRFFRIDGAPAIFLAQLLGRLQAPLAKFGGVLRSLVQVLDLAE